jgi:hypothetical protein
VAAVAAGSRRGAVLVLFAGSPSDRMYAVLDPRIRVT